MFITKKGYVVDQILHLILSGEIKPGTQLNQRELAEKLNTSITPVREALMQLEIEGLIQFTPHKGAQVVEINAEDAYYICLVRSSLEVLALELAFPNITPKYLLEITHIQNKMEEALHNNELAIVKTLNLEFHKKIISLAQSQAIADIIEHVYRKLPWNAFPAKYDGVEKIIEGHRALIDAIEKKNLIQAKIILSNHINEWGAFLKVYLNQNGHE